MKWSQGEVVGGDILGQTTDRCSPCTVFRSETGPSSQIRAPRAEPWPHRQPLDNHWRQLPLFEGHFGRSFQAGLKERFHCSSSATTYPAFFWLLEFPEVLIWFWLKCILIETDNNKRGGGWGGSQLAFVMYFSQCHQLHVAATPLVLYFCCCLFCLCVCFTMH